MPAPQNVIAVIFDFDDTLTDDSTTRLLKEYNIDSDDFWKSHKNRVQAGWTNPLSYLNQIIDNVGEGEPFGRLKNEDLRDFGSELDFYPGIPKLFEDLEAIVDQHPQSNPSVEFYIISGGLLPIIRGSVISDYFRGIWGCEFGTNSDGVITSIKRAVTFTEKTRYIFCINKGLITPVGGVDTEDEHKPYLVNKNVEEDERRIPLENMIYVGDGLTDIPCFSLIDKNDGEVYGVFDSEKEGSPKSSYNQLLAPRRVQSMNKPEYGEEDPLGSLLRQAVEAKAMELDNRTKSAF